MSSYNISVKKFEPTDPRLGRHVWHDERSLLYQVQAEPMGTLASVRHHLNIHTLDQGNVGSCTGNAGTLNLSGDTFWQFSAQFLSPNDSVANEQYAVGLYSEATKIDSAVGSYPPTDTGSDGLSIAKVLQKRGLIGGYQHATSLQALLTALAKQPVIVGTEWRQNMFYPAGGKMDITGAVQGGHEYCLDQLDVENKRIWMHNSWADSWGEQGRAFFTYDQMDELLDAQGDCTVFSPLTQPAPTPTPTPTPVVTPLQKWKPLAQAWTSAKHTGANQQFSKDTKAYLATLV